MKEAVAKLFASPTATEDAMNNDIIAGKWQQVKGKAQAKWGDLTDDVFDIAGGDSRYLAGKLQERYGWDRDRAEREVSEFERTLDSASRARHDDDGPAIAGPSLLVCKVRDRKLAAGATPASPAGTTEAQRGSGTKRPGNARGACRAIGQYRSGRGAMPSATSRRGLS